MNRILAVTGVLVLLSAGILFRKSTASQSKASLPVTLFLMLGEKAKSVERWDGSLRVADGAVARTEGWHFSAGDAVTGAGRWRCGTRRDEVAPYADIHYTEMRPGAKPELLFHPIGVYVTVRPASETRVSVETAQGNFDFALSEIGIEPKLFLDGRALVALVPSEEKLSTKEYEDDEPTIAALPGGSIAVAWVAYRDRADRILLRTRENGSWSAAEEITPRPADIFRCSLAADQDGGLWVFWSQREDDRWHIWGRRKKAGAWQNAGRLTADGSNIFHRAASGGGTVFIAWQSFRQGQSDIYLKSFRNGSWSEEVRLSESRANDWEPAIAAGSDGAAHVAWDTYDKGNYDVQFRSWRDGRLSPVYDVTSSPKFQAHASVAIDAQNRPWVTWDESGVNWGKDQGFLIPAPLAVPLHQERSVRVALWDGKAWLETRGKLAAAFRQNAEHPRIAFDGRGALSMLFRHWTRHNRRSIGSPIVWENYLTRLDGTQWSTPLPLAHSGGSIEKHAAVARDPGGELWAAWMSDERPFSTMVPMNAEVYCARIGLGQPATASFEPMREPGVEAIPVHNNEAGDLKAIRSYTITAGAKQYKIYRGDMHRHTDVSQDFKYDGSLLEVYRYGLDAAGFDYIAATDHQTGYDQEFTWWQNQKLVDLFSIPGAFAPLFAYERSVPYPNGHRNVIFAHRGVRTLPIPVEERAGDAGAARLYEYLRKNRGISMPHSSATAQGTDWRDNDAEVEPLIEIYQGYRTSYEYEGAPRAATTLNQHAQKSGWQPQGFWWNALAKGYRLGVQSSSDHWSTHISYACIIADSFTREGLFDAMRKRHTYGATDNIILDFRARSGNTTYLMGDSFSAQSPPRLILKAAGTGAIKQVDLIKNQKFIYTSQPGTREASFEFTDKDFAPGETWYYVRLLQEDGQLAWSSPIWVKR